MSISKNDITGDTIASKTSTEAYRNNFDAIFRKKAHEPENEPECSEHSMPAPAELEEAVDRAIKSGNWPFPVVNGEPR
jgi:hypothetical protein